MKILMLPNLFYPNMGGVEVAVGNLCRQFRLKGHEVEIVTTRWPRELPAHDRVGGVKVTRLPFMLPSLKGKEILTFPIRFLQSWMGLEQVLCNTPFDVVNLHYLSEAAFYAGLSCGWRGLPIVASLHGADIEQTPLVNPVQRRVTCKMVRSAAALTTNSSALAESVIQLVGQGVESRLTVVGNGVNVEDFDVDPERPPGLPKRYIAAVGRMVHKKGLDILIRAFVIVADQYPEVDLVLVGDGAERGSLETLSSALNLGNRIHFAGFQPNHKIAAYLRYADFAVIPSRMEPFGIVALEAMAARKAVVAMGVGGLREIISDEQTGLLVPDRTPVALAEAIIRLLRQPQLAIAMGQRGRVLVETHYKWETVAERHLDIFRRVATTGTGKR